MMRNRLALKLMNVIAPFTILTSVAQAHSEENGIQTLTDYFEMIVSGNLESAGLMWREDCAERSGRFSIEYTGVPLKIDCGSPIVYNLPVMRNHLLPPVKQSQQLNPKEFTRLLYSNFVGGKLVEHNYHVQDMHGYYALIYPQDFFAREWKLSQTKYFRIHTHPQREQFLNGTLLAEADRCVERIADSLGLEKKDLKEFATRKIEFYYCDSDSTVGAITGTITQGQFDVASNDVISADFPHAHELVHLLVNVKLKQLPLFTLPILREGVAVRYGGRWGKRSTSLMDLGVFLLKEQIVILDSIITAPGFRGSSGADIAYPVAGVFVSYLIDKLGQSKFLDLYRTLSVETDVLDTLNHLYIQSTLTKALGLADWPTLVADFSAYGTMVTEKQASILPGSAPNGSPLLKEDSVTVLGDPQWLSFEIASDSATAPKGNILFSLDERLKGRSSLLFEQQYGGSSTPFEGYRYGVRFDGNEAGLYDYGTNELVAKYIWGITPSEKYFDQAEKKIRIHVRRSLIGKAAPKKNDFKVLPQ